MLVLAVSGADADDGGMRRSHCQRWMPLPERLNALH